MESTAEPTCFLIADISGYTGYLASVELDHAEDVLSDLLGVIVSALRPYFRLSRIEGDAAFMFATVTEIDGSLLLDMIERCYFGFRRRQRDIEHASACSCDACRQIPDLDLKFVVHHGPALLQTVAGGRELLGMGAIVIHRLLKNDVVERLGVNAYAFISQDCIDVSDLEPAALGMREHTEAYDRIGDVSGWVCDLGPRWREEEERSRVRLRPDEALVDLSLSTRVPQQVAWEVLTEPGRRMSWQPWVTSVEVEGATGGRRGIGSANHCMHGEDAVVEEILDWRPYDYVTDRTILETPDGPVKVLHTIALEPEDTGTRIHMLYGPAKTERERAAMEVIGPAYGEALRSGLPSLAEQLEAEWSVRDPDPDAEPEPPAPSGRVPRPTP